MKIIVETEGRNYEFAGNDDLMWWSVDGEILLILERSKGKVTNKAAFRQWTIVRVEEE